MTYPNPANGATAHVKITVDSPPLRRSLVRAGAARSLACGRALHDRCSGLLPDYSGTDDLDPQPCACACHAPKGR